eukprot:COSAG02_NODE_46093_length_351_cov_2.031746_1_plen_24_part_10
MSQSAVPAGCRYFTGSAVFNLVMR